MTLTYDSYDQLLERFDQMNAPAYWPSLSELEVMEDNPDKFIIFACYLDSKCDLPKDSMERYSKHYLTKFINDNLTLIE